MNSLGLITINHNRPKILKLWCAQVKRLRVQTHIDIPAVVVSEKEDKSICNSFSVVHITQENRPVTAKWNTAMKYMQSINAGSTMILGSDDIISTDYFYDTLNKINNGSDYVGTTTLYFYCGQGVDKGKLVRLDHRKTLGTARTVSKTILDQCDWTLWTEEKNWAMDAIATKNIVKYAQKKTIAQGMVVDVKTKQNLNSYNVWGRRLPVCNPLEFYNTLSEEEFKILQSL